MANQKVNGGTYKYAVVDTAPDVSGFFTDVLTPRASKIGRFYFSIRSTGNGGSVATVKLQYQCLGDDVWTDYLNQGNDWDVGSRVMINDFAAGVHWRAGVLENGYTSGEVTFGFDW